jgi:cytochrome c
MKTAGFTWSKPHIFMYLKNPSKYVPGNKMAFAGIDSEAERANLIAYLDSV